MAKAQQEKDEPRTQVVVAMIGAAAVIVVGVLGVIGSVLSNESDGRDPEATAITGPSAFDEQKASPSPTATATFEYIPTTVYVTSVSTTGGGLSPRSVTWKFTGTVKPPPGARGAVFVLGKTIDGSMSVNSDPVSIASDGTWVAVVGPVPRDFAWKMKWIAAYGEMLVNDANPNPNTRAEAPPNPNTRPGAPLSPGTQARAPLSLRPRAEAPRYTTEPRVRDPGDQANERDSESGDSIQPEAVTEIPKKMLPRQSP